MHQKLLNAFKGGLYSPKCQPVELDESIEGSLASQLRVRHESSGSSRCCLTEC